MHLAPTVSCYGLASPGKAYQHGDWLRLRFHLLPLSHSYTIDGNELLQKEIEGGEYCHLLKPEYNIKAVTGQCQQETPL